MIPAIGLMIAAYVVTRMWQMILRTTPKEHGFVVVCACATIVVTVLCSVDLILGSSTSARGLLSLMEVPAPEGTDRVHVAEADATPFTPHVYPLVGQSEEAILTWMGPPTKVDQSSSTASRWTYVRDNGRTLVINFVKGHVTETTPSGIDRYWLNR